ncbi:hypothetical protein ATCVBr0604L_057L [Acanthocystis turfacea Chlorella virus Br0604L]|nr:hypothetical protein ATCVBr0604L_057L [Acanthocystis turfacea Chlorella virus Br0604L]
MDLKNIISALKPGTTAFYLVAAIVAIVLVTIVVNMTKKKQENFSFKNIFNKIANVGKDVGNTVKNVAVGGFEVAKGVVAPGSNSYKPTFAARYWNGRTWACPNGSIDYGTDYNNGFGCLTSQFGPTVNGKCPTNSTPNNDSDPNKACITGYSGRSLVNGQWQCLTWQTPTGRDWSNSDWFTAQQQCQVNNTIFTQRIYDEAKQTWACPANTVDTGFTWGSTYTNQDGGKEEGGYYACQYTN